MNFFLEIMCHLSTNCSFLNMSSQKRLSQHTSFRVITPGNMFPRRSSSSGMLSQSSVQQPQGRFVTPSPSPRGGPRWGRPVTAPEGKDAEGKGRKSNSQLNSARTKGTRSPKLGSRPRTIDTLLPPRKISSISTCEGDCGGKEKVKIDKVHFSEGFSAHKCHWVKKAIEQLGNEWVLSGKISQDVIQSEGFHEKMGILYDLTMAKKHEGIDRLVNEEVGGGKGGKRKGGGGEVQGNFPFAEHITGKVKESMSEALLRILMRSETKKESKKEGKEVVGPKKKTDAKEDNSSSSNSFEKSLKKRKRSLVQCYVIDGRLVVGTKDKMLSVGGSFVNQFGESKLSRARRATPAEGPCYFRQTCNMMGFHPHEVNIRFCKNSRQLIVSGARPKRGNENARQVRETIEIPKPVDIGSLAVLRTSKGSLIFEELEG